MSKSSGQAAVYRTKAADRSRKAQILKTLKATDSWEDANAQEQARLESEAI